MHYFQQNRLWCAENAVSLDTGCCFSLCVFLHRCTTTVTPSRVYKPLPLPYWLAVGGSESCVYTGFTRCWFNHWTDDRLSQQLRRQIHSPTLSRLPRRFFAACFVYMRLSLVFLSLFLLAPYQCCDIFFFFSHFSLAHSQGFSTSRITHKHNRSLSSCVWIPIIHHLL